MDRFIIEGPDMDHAPEHAVFCSVDGGNFVPVKSVSFSSVDVGPTYETMGALIMPSKEALSFDCTIENQKDILKIIGPPQKDSCMSLSFERRVRQRYRHRHVWQYRRDRMWHRKRTRKPLVKQVITYPNLALSQASREWSDRAEPPDLTLTVEQRINKNERYGLDSTLLAVPVRAILN